jgi:hypothetical protein
MTKIDTHNHIEFYLTKSAATCKKLNQCCLVVISQLSELTTSTLNDRLVLFLNFDATTTQTIKISLFKKSFGESHNP